MRIDCTHHWFGKTYELDPSFRQYFPEARQILYTDQLKEHPDFDEVIRVSSGFSGEREGHRAADFSKGQSLLKSDAAHVFAFDADMKIVSKRVRKIMPLAFRFGICLPANPRYLVAVDQEIGADTNEAQDESKGQGYAMNCGIIAHCTHHQVSKITIQAFCDEMRENPVRGPLAWWRAAWRTGYAPYILPPQWCVCQGDVGIGNEIILHIGHQKVREYYNVR